MPKVTEGRRENDTGRGTSGRGVLEEPCRGENMIGEGRDLQVCLEGGGADLLPTQLTRLGTQDQYRSARDHLGGDPEGRVSSNKTRREENKTDFEKRPVPSQVSPPGLSTTAKKTLNREYKSLVIGVKVALREKTYTGHEK